MAFYTTAVFFCWSLLMFLSSAGHPYLVADLPFSVPYFGLVIPSAVHQWIVPSLLAFLYWSATRRMAGKPIWVILSLAVISALAVVWLVTLARHDRILSLFQVLLLLWVAWNALPRRVFGWVMRAGVLACLAVPLAVVSYGAIWGETRCEAAWGVGCLTADGPRVWVPKMLAAIGVSVFADLSDADLQTANLSRRDLRYADLRGADLKAADLRGSNLRRALIDGATASSSNWRDAYLDGASFVGAGLSGAVLSGVHAYRVDFRGADLTNTDIRNASLSHASLAEARMNGVLLNGTYMRFVEGLVASQLAEACGDRDTLLAPGLSIRPCLSTKGQ